jgi:hypothetical protein
MIGPNPANVDTRGPGNTSLQQYHDIIIDINTKNHAAHPGDKAHDDLLNTLGFKLQQDELNWQADPSGGSSGTAGKTFIYDLEKYESAAGSASGVDALIKELDRVSGYDGKGNLQVPGDPNSQSGKAWQSNFLKNAKDAPKFGLSAPTGDGEIRLGNSKQLDVGDCFILSAIGAVNAEPGGPEKLNSLIHTNSDGSYDVTFPGDLYSKKYRVTADELKHTNVASGDLTTKILAIAADQWDKDNVGGKQGEGKGVDDGGHESGALTLLTGKYSSYSKTDSASISSAIMQGAKSGNPIEVKVKVSSDPNDKDYHAIFVDKYDPKTDKVTWHDPHDTGKSYTQTMSTFLSSPDGEVVKIVSAATTTPSNGFTTGNWNSNRYTAQM